jgi:hypothetical protein
MVFQKVQSDQLDRILLMVFRTDLLAQWVQWVQKLLMVFQMVQWVQ